MSEDQINWILFVGTIYVLWKMIKESK